jgi:hypothetical protein
LGHYRSYFYYAMTYDPALLFFVFDAAAVAAAYG